MFRFLFTYSKVLIVLLVALGIYCVAVVPAIEPPPGKTAPKPVFTKTLPSEYWWQEFFEEGSWQREGSNKVINAKQGVLISQNWEQLDKKTWKLQPLTLIMPQSSKDQAAVYEASNFDARMSVADKEMWIVTADEGATIHFDEAPSLASGGSLPTVNRGDLSGKIEVTRKTPNQGEERPWRLVTSELLINRRQVTTENEVLIEWGSSVIRGRSLRILLQGNLLSSQEDSSGWGPLDELELYNVDEIEVELPPGGLWSDMEVGRFKTEPELRKLPARLQANSGGRFSFDFKQSIARLQNGVQLVHQLGALPPDKFFCDSMTVKVQPPSKQSEDSKLRVEAFEAFGVDSLQNFVGEKWVEILAPTLELAARAKTLAVDLASQSVTLSGKLQQPGATQSIVKLQFEGHEFQSPRIEYQAPAKEAPFESLGWMVAEGPGELTTSGEGQAGESHVRWQNSLQLRPANGEAGGWIELDGNTLVESKDYGFLASDRIEVWLQKTANVALGLPADQFAGDYVPRRIRSKTQTVLATDMLKAQVDELDISLTFAAPDIVLDGNGQPVGQVTENATDQGLALQDAAGNPMYQFVGPPADDGEKTTLEPAKPISVTGSNLSATIASAGKATWIDQLAISGPVKVWRESADPKDLPWHAEGKLMLAETNRAGHVDMQVEGTPAKVVLADGMIEGPAIRVNQEHNIVLIDHPGECTLPKSLIKQSESPTGQRFEWIDAPHVKWMGRLLFDGKQVVIEDDIDFAGSIVTEQDQYWLLTGNCQRLDMILQEPVELSSSQTKRASIDRLVLQDKVNVFASELDARGEKQSRQHMFLPKLVLHVPAEEIVGSGTGWIKSWFVQRGRLGRLASSEPQSQASLRAANLQFRDRMFGKIGSGSLTFEGKVEMFTGKIDSWEQPIQLLEANELQEGEFLLNADQLQVVDTAQLSSSQLVSGKEAWEFQATGNVAFNGAAEQGEFSGTGDRLSYQQNKDQLILRGTERKPAYVQQTTKGPNGRVYQGNLNYIEIDAETMTPSNAILGAGGVRVEDRDGGNTGPSLPNDRTIDPRRAADSFYNRRQP